MKIYLRENKGRAIMLQKSQIYHAGLLSLDRYKIHKNEFQAALDKPWWLSTHSKYRDGDVNVVWYDGNVQWVPHNAMKFGIRPVLFLKDRFTDGEKAVFGGHYFTIIANSIAICDDVIGTTLFGFDSVPQNEVVEYDDSYAKLMVDGWYNNVVSNIGDENCTVLSNGDLIEWLDRDTKEVVIPASVKKICMYVFEQRPRLKKVIIPEGVEVISSYAFSECYNLTSVNLPNTIMQIGSHAFAFCKRLKKVTLPNQILRINSMAFTGCEGLTDVEIPEGPNQICSDAFSGCASLEEIYLPNSIQHIGGSAFSYCTNLKRIRIPETIKSFGDNVFENCNELQEIVFGEDVFDVRGLNIGDKVSGDDIMNVIRRAIQDKKDNEMGIRTDAQEADAFDFGF